MIKKLILAIAIALPLSLMAQSVKLGTVELNSVMSAMPEFTNMQTQLESAQKAYQEEFKKINDEMDKKYAEYQKLVEDPSVNSGIKERRMQELNDLKAKAEQFVGTAQQDLQRQQAQLQAPIEEKIMNAIKAVGQENGFLMILPEGVAAYQSPDVVDATPLVKAKLGIQQ